MSEPVVEFLNVDVDVYGAFDRAALVSGFGDAIVVLYEGAAVEGGPELSFELNGPSNGRFRALSQS